MTRVYDALLKSRNQQADALLAAIDDEQAENTRVLAVAAGGAVPQPIPAVQDKAAKAIVTAVQEPYPGPVALDAAPALRAPARVAAVAPAAAPFTQYRQVKVEKAFNPLLFPFDGADGPAADQYRVLRTNIVHHPARPSMIVVSSATPGDGKTLTAINTAGILARKDEGDVLIVDGDLRRRSIGTFLGIEENPGFADVLEGRCTLDQAIAKIDLVHNLHVLTAGTPTVNPAELLDSTACREALIQLRERFRYVIVDTAPIGVLTDFDLMQACCDGVIVVVRPDHTDRKLLKDALTHLPADSVLGVVLNAHENWLFSKSTTAYAYEYDRKGKEPWHAPSGV